MTPKHMKKMAISALALGAASAAVIFGSFASWTAQTANPGNSITTGTLTMTNSKPAAAVFTATGIKPGDTNGSTVVVTNSGSTPMSTVKLTQGTITNTVGTDLTLKIHDDTTNRCIWPTQAAGACAAFGVWDGSATLTNFNVQGTGGTSTWAAAEAHTFTASWDFALAAANATQSKAAAFGLTWDGAQ